MLLCQIFGKARVRQRLAVKVRLYLPEAATLLVIALMKSPDYLA